MNPIFRIRLIFTFSLLALIPARTPAATITWFNSEGLELRDAKGALLYPGTAAGAHDGDLIQLGYYSMGTISDPFNGIWTALISGSIGDNAGNLPGRYGYATEISAGELLPGVPLVVRFYDAPTLENAIFFNAFTDSGGRWNAIDGDLTLSLLNSGPVWQSGKISGLRTVIPVPETSSAALPGIGLVAALLRRRHVTFLFRKPTEIFG